tara:strand:+ start:133 stop:522 length:390 start_codon:yes stop_codon:yes gene_type:complete
MELSYIIKIKIYFLLVFNLLRILFIFKFRSFDHLIKFLKSITIKKNKLKLDEKSIFNREKKLSKILKINKCLITSAYLYKTLRDLGFKAEFFIGIKKDDIFSSHAWVELSDKNLIDQQNKLFKKIVRLN